MVAFFLGGRRLVDDPVGRRAETHAAGDGERRERRRAAGDWRALAGWEKKQGIVARQGRVGTIDAAPDADAMLRRSAAWVVPASWRRLCVSVWRNLQGKG